MNQTQEWNLEKEFNLLKTRIGVNIFTFLRQSVKDCLEQQGEENILSPTPQKAEEMVEEIMKKFVEQTKEIIFNQKILEKLEKNQEITLEDIDWQSKQVKIFELWLSQQIEGYLILKLRYYRQQGEKHKAKSEKYKKIEEVSQNLLDLIRQKQKKIAEGAESRKKEGKKLAIKIIKNLELEKKNRQKQLTKDYEEWADDSEEQAEIKAWNKLETDGWDD